MSFFLANALFGYTISNRLHRFLYNPRRLWFTRHRIAPGLGVISLCIGVVVFRGLLRHTMPTDHKRELETAMDVLSCLGATTSFSVGVLVADLMRARD